MSEDGVAALVLPCGATTLVMLASWVDAIDDLRRVDGDRRDVVRLLGLEAAIDARERRAVRVRGGLWLAVGHEVVMRTLPANAFGPVPAWLGRVADRAPIAALVRLEKTFGFEVDVARIVYAESHEWT